VRWTNEIETGTTWIYPEKTVGTIHIRDTKNNTTVAYRGGGILENTSNITHNKTIWNQRSIRDFRHKVEARWKNESLTASHYPYVGWGKSYKSGSTPAPKNPLACAAAASGLQLVDGHGPRCQKLPQGVVRISKYLLVRGWRTIPQWFICWLRDL